jgi:hypothetical protein
MRFLIPSLFQPHAAAALVRLQYLYPAVSFALNDAGFAVEPVDDVSLADLRRDIAYALYREKIFADTLPMREALLRAVTA